MNVPETALKKYNVVIPKLFLSEKHALFRSVMRPMTAFIQTL
jgi:hypothetical protein